LQAHEAAAPARADDRALLIEAVREGGALALGYFRTDIRKWMKGGDSIVTEADIAVNELLHARLAATRPGYGWLSEETEDAPQRLSRSRVWVVDPIDGTRAFARGKPHFVLSVALVENGRPVLGALFNPATGEFFEAAAGEGARLNGDPIRVSERDSIEGCRMAAHGAMFAHPGWAEPWPAMEFVERNSVAYRLALVACGQADAALALTFKNDWDLAAADLIIHEAGGRLTTHEGRELVYNREIPRHRSLLAAGPRLHGRLGAHLGGLVLPG